MVMSDEHRPVAVASIFAPPLVLPNIRFIEHLTRRIQNKYSTLIHNHRYQCVTE